MEAGGEGGGWGGRIAASSSNVWANSCPPRTPPTTPPRTRLVMVFLKYLPANRCVDTLPLHCLAAGSGREGEETRSTN